MAMLFAFAGYLRISEVVQLRIRDIEETEEAISLNVRSAKRNPNGFKAIIAKNTLTSKFWKKYKKKFNLMANLANNVVYESQRQPIKSLFNTE